MTPAQAARVETFPELNARPGWFSHGARITRVVFWRGWVAGELVPAVSWRDTVWVSILVDGGIGDVMHGLPDDARRTAITLATLTEDGIVYHQHRAKMPARRHLKQIRRRKVSDALPF